MDGKGVQTLDRALDIIELLSIESEGIGVTEIGTRLSLHKSTVHRLLNALAQRGYIEKDEKRGNYKLGLKFVEIGSLRLNQIELKTEAVPFLRRLAELVRQPVHLAILRGHDAVYIEKIEPITSIRMYSQIGKRIPLYCSALGKALLSGLDNEAYEALIPGIPFESHTPKTHTDKESLRLAVESVRLKGWASDDEEHELGIRCVAAPIRDYTGKVIASTSIGGDKSIVSQEKDEEYARLVMETAAEISRRMGYITKNTRR